MITLDIDSGSGPRRVALRSYLDPQHEEQAHDEAYAWIKAVRHLEVDGVPFRRRFTFRGDSLWWFAELYLHKERVILEALRTIAAFDALVERERPLTIRYVDGSNPGVVAQAAAARKVRYSGPGWPATPRLALLRMEARATALAVGARLSTLRAAPAAARPGRIAAFVHTAFWRADGADGGAESYIGPVLRALETRATAAAMRYVGIGARSNFRARRWWDPIVARDGTTIVPIERYAPAAALAGSRAVYRDRHRARRGMWQSAALRAHAVIRGCDCWPLVRQQLAGIALLQFPWSARSMDQAAAALDALAPEVAVTYAEAGGWGRALALECRRRGVPLAGLQHGFIYRHWLNYRHEADEMIADPANPSDRGFPCPSATLLFDEHAAQHLLSKGRYPASTLAVTGSARLDELSAAMRAVTPEDTVRVRTAYDATAPRALVLLAAKEREARPFLPALLDAVRGMPDVQLVIKPHPAEVPGVYASVIAGVRNVRVAADVPLPSLLAAADAIVTINSTVAIDALAFGVPSLVIGLPNNLTPFVEAGRMAGAGPAPEEIRGGLANVLYNQEFRSSLHSRAVHPAHNDGQAAARSAEAILGLARSGPG